MSCLSVPPKTNTHTHTLFFIITQPQNGLTNEPTLKTTTAAASAEQQQQQHFAPKLIHQPQSATVQPSKPHTVECAVESEPEAEVKWFKDDQLLGAQPAHSEQQGNELIFFQMNEEDSGEYRCQATNYLGSIASEPFRLTVHSSKYSGPFSRKLPPSFLPSFLPGRWCWWRFIYLRRQLARGLTNPLN